MFWFQVVFRSVLSGYLKAGNNGAVEPIIQFCIAYALAEAAAAAAVGGAGGAPVAVPPTGKLPFLLFEDLMEGSKLEGGDECWSVRRAWALLESCAEPLTMPVATVPGTAAASGSGGGPLFAKGKLVLLRLCNGVLRRLSKSLDSEWCGRVLLFLTAAFPLSERSAVNVKGEINALNVTQFEDRKHAAEEFGEEEEEEEEEEGGGGGKKKAEDEEEDEEEEEEEDAEDKALREAEAKKKVEEAAAAIEAKAQAG
jgi:hypothetical protein